MRFKPSRVTAQPSGRAVPVQLETSPDDLLGGRRLSQGPFADLFGRAERACPAVEPPVAMPRPRRTNGRSRIVAAR